jgi:hypothetical protein
MCVSETSELILIIYGIERCVCTRQKTHTHTILKHKDALLIGIKEVLKVNTEKPWYMLMLSEQNNNINTANKSSENLSKFIYWGMMQMKIACIKNLRADYIQVMPVSFGPESFVFQFAIKKYKD